MSLVIVVVVLALFTRWVAVPVLPMKLLSPAYVAVSVFEPALVDVSEQVPEATVPVQLLVPSLIVTLPVGVPVPGAFTLTLKLMVYAWPVTDGSGESLVMAVVVSAFAT